MIEYGSIKIDQISYSIQSKEVEVACLATSARKLEQDVPPWQAWQG
jgi:hypothetical protein